VKEKRKKFYKLALTPNNFGKIHFEAIIYNKP